MRFLGRILTALILLFTAPSTADINLRKIRSDNQSLIFLEEFRFTNTGYVSVAISSVSVNSPFQDFDRLNLGFFLQKSAIEELQENPNTCVLNSKSVSLLFTFQDLSPPPQSSFNKVYHVKDPDQYSLYFANCNPHSLVTMDVRTKLYNIESRNTKSYLSVGKTQLPSLYVIFSIIYLCFLGFCISIRFNKKRSFHRHCAMGCLLVMVAINLTSEVLDTYHVMVTGIHKGWAVSLYNFEFLRFIHLFTMFIVTGWCLLMYLQEKDNHHGMANLCLWLMILISVQVMANVGCQVIKETRPSHKWYTVSVLVDIFWWVASLCLFCVPLPSVVDEDNKFPMSLCRLIVFWYFLHSFAWAVPEPIYGPFDQS